MTALGGSTIKELLDELGRRIGALNLLEHPQGADIEILDVLWSDGERPPCVKPSVIRINGTDVGLIARGGIEVDVGTDKYPASVTVTLFPRSIIIGAGIR